MKSEMAEAHERKVKRILSRDWSELRDWWIDHVPNISPSGSPPSDALAELTSLEARLKAITKNQVEEVAEDLPGVRAGLLHESLFLLHKSAHVLGSSLVHVEAGMCTWSISNAYQSAFFGIKAVMGFLGVCVLEVENRHFLVDVWGAPHKPRKNLKPPIIVLANTRRNEQRHVWAYFQRTLEQTINHESAWSTQVQSTLVQPEFTDFGRQRNALHYQTSEWPLADLHQCVANPEFARRVTLLDDSRPDWTVLIAFLVVNIARGLLADLARSSRILAEELEVVDAWLGQPFNERFHQATSA